jgi:hypothetical protein
MEIIYLVQRDKILSCVVFGDELFFFWIWEKKKKIINCKYVINYMIYYYFIILNISLTININENIIVSLISFWKHTVCRM